MKRSFTLIELLIVTVIIGIIAAIVSISITGARRKAKNSKIDADLAMVKSSLEMYYKETGELPTAEDWCKISAEATGCLSELVERGYLQSLPLGPEGKCPNGVVSEADRDKCYYYYNADGQNYVVVSGIKDPPVFGSFPHGPGCSIAEGGLKRSCQGFLK